MTFDDLVRLKRWHAQRRQHRPLEVRAMELTFLACFFGLLGVPVAVVSGRADALIACLLLLMSPLLYLQWRRRLHDTGRLRCDWLSCVHQPVREEEEEQR